MLIESSAEPVQNLGKRRGHIVPFVALEIVQYWGLITLKALRFLRRNVHRLEDVSSDALSRVVAANQLETAVEDHAPSTQARKHQIAVSVPTSSEITDKGATVEIFTKHQPGPLEEASGQVEGRHRSVVATGRSHPRACYYQGDPDRGLQGGQLLPLIVIPEHLAVVAGKNNDRVL